MKVRDVMTKQVIWIRPEESVHVAARTLEHYNIGALPVCCENGLLQGILTDRDLVVRSLAVGGGENDIVANVMTRRIVSVGSNTEVEQAMKVMGDNQVRRLPVVENGKLCGMLSMADLSRDAMTSAKTGEMLSRINSGVSRR